MNKTDRLLAIVLELQGKGRQRAEDLAKTFETSKRTIYRDIQALCEAGVPLISIPGQGYSLMKGYFLPPLSFTTEEATMLLLGSEYMARNFDAQYRAAAQSASRKIASVLPEQLREDVSYLQNSIYFIVPSAEHNASEHAMLQQLRRALLERTTVRFNYHARYSADEQDAATVREVDPYGLVYFRNEWLLTGYCHLRQDIRYFRLDRIDELALLSRTFQRPGNFQVRENRGYQARNIVVRVLFDPEVSRWVREGPLYYTVAEEEAAEGLLVTLKVRREDELVQWLLGWGRHVHVQEPESLRERIAEEAAAMVRNHQQVE
ncbi:MAG TPA: YafY family protein [Ktedonobacteraceae bacterium]|jgi:predicted DNA-binding transcriptional regulator YafY|nr:YafY family protein [Ktedonobacteraceae bacterium]